MTPKDREVFIEIGPAYRLDSVLGYVSAVPCPLYVWQFWKWQKVRCACGKTFITRDLRLIPKEYEAHYALEHI